MNQKMHELSPPPVHPVTRNIALRFDHVSFSYEKVKVLENASFHIHQGEFVALTGPNGSGKTTALKLLLGIEKAQAGTIELFGEPFSRIKNQVGYVPQQAHLDRAFPITVREVVNMGRLNPLSRFFSAADRLAVEKALEQAEIADLSSRPYYALSGGERRRVLVARALASLAMETAEPDLLVKKPGLLVLDEPTANMDAESEDRLFVTLGKLKGSTTILIVTHDSDFVSSLVDRVLCMGKGAHGSEQVSQYTIVQHRLEHLPESRSSDHRTGDARIPDSRILHEESFPGDNCYPGEADE